MKNNLHIIADTNMYLSKLDMLQRLLDDEYPFFPVLCILNIILEELDRKKSMKATRDAIRFLDSQRDNAHLLFLDKTDIVLPNVTNNDDVIIELAKHVQNSVLITQDILMSIKAQQRGVICILVGKKHADYEQVKKQIVKAVGVDSVETYKRNTLGQSYLLDRTRDLLLYPILRRLYEAMGDSFTYFLSCQISELSLNDLLNIVIKHYSLFQNYIPKYSDAVIRKLMKNIEEKDTKEMRSTLGLVLAIFGVVDDEIK